VAGVWRLKDMQRMTLSLRVPPWSMCRFDDIRTAKVMDRQPRSPKISVITPLYNSSRHIEETLNSLCRQSYADWESILVNDGSTDDSAEKVKPYLSDPRFSYTEQANGGVAAARNTGVKAARGEWVCLLDHDDLWMPAKLERQLAFAVGNGYDIVCTSAVAVTKRSRKPYSAFYPQEYIDKLERSSTDPGIDVFELLIRHDFLWASSVMLRRSLFDTVGPFNLDVSPAEDYDMWLRCVPHARIGYLAEPLLEYRIHAGNASHNFTRMAEKTILVLHRAADRHRDDPRRIRQFERELIEKYRTLLAELLEEHEYGSALRHIISLIARDRAGLRLVYRIGDQWLFSILRRSLRGKRKTRRSVFGDIGSDTDGE
jgi:glycosyltransferase involved in cell wall biosynthesis